MNNSIIRRAPAAALRQLNLSIHLSDEMTPGTECEVVELQGEEGCQRWQDSVFVQDFEDSMLTAPTPLSEDFKPAG
jgi:hypothetical protein